MRGRESLSARLKSGGKKILPLTLGLIVLALVWGGRGSVQQADQPLGSGLPVLMYHKIVKLDRPSLLRTSPAAFAAQMTYLDAHGYHTISLEQWLRHVKSGTPLPSHPIIITFDDGYQDNLTHALPILQAHHFTATFFIIAGKVGGTVRWVHENGRPTAQLMNWSGIRKMADAGMEIGAHTMTHPDLTKLSYQEQLAQMEDARRVIAEHTGRLVDVLSYPFGSYNADSLKAATVAGYSVAVTTKQGFDQSKTPLLELRRIRVRGGESLGLFARSLQVGYSGSRP